MEAKSNAAEIIELTKKNERIFLETVDDLVTAREDLKKANGRCIELAELLVKSSDEVRHLKVSNRTVCVRDFFVQVAPNQEKHDKPTVPAEDTIRLRVRIDAEEFVEKLNAVFDDPAAIAQLRHQLKWFDVHSKIRSDLHARLPELADALADQAYTNEGFAIAFGINLDPVFGLVHRANLTKKGGPIVAGKTMKPEGWKAPDVAGELVKQGWEPSVAAKVWHGIPIEDGHVPSVCEVHGVVSGDGTACVRCENAQYDGIEIDPISEHTDDKLATPICLTMKAQPIDVSIWDRKDKVEIPSALVLVPDMSIVCRVLFLNNGKERRLMIEFIANDELFGRWERLRQDEKVCDVSVDGIALGKTGIASVERGHTRPDSSYKLQVEFVKMDPRKAK
jgi:predicted HAD superfamily Cof-like phosphohydrolase